MKRILAIIFCISIFISLSVSAQNTLTIEISKIKNSNGQVVLEFCNEKGDRISGHTQSITNSKSVIVIKNLKPGKYSFKYFHDANKNNEMDTNWIGMPTEGIGFSNNAKGSFGPPDVEKTVFEIKGNHKVVCSPIYL